MKETLDLGVYLHEGEGEGWGGEEGQQGAGTDPFRGPKDFRFSSGSVCGSEDDLTSPFYFSLTSEK